MSLEEVYAKRPYKAKCVKTGTVVGFNTLVDLRDALSGGCVVRIGDANAPDPTRNYSRMTTDQVRQLCQVRNVRGFVTLSHEDQIKALKDLDARDDAAVSAPVSAPATTEPEVSEIDALKAEADSLGVEYATNIGVAKLRERVEAVKAGAQ